MVYKSQGEWGWRMAIEIFCGGTAGSTYILSVLPYLFFGGRIFLSGVLTSLVLVLISVFVLMTDLNSAWRARRAFLNIQSPISVGAISLSLFIILSVATVAMVYTGLLPGLLYLVAWLGVLASLLTILYPGVLMGLMKAIPFWGGSGSPLLLLSASLVSGSAAATLVGGLSNVNFNLSRVTLSFLVIHGLFLFIYMMMGTQGSKAAQISVQRLIKGNLFSLFIIGVIAIGWVVPLLLYIVGIILSSATLLLVGSGLILIGGILLRYSLIASGVRVPVLREDSISATYWLYHRG